MDGPWDKGGILSTLTSISDVRRFFCRNQRPIYYISATNFNLQGMDEWVYNFKSLGNACAPKRNRHGNALHRVAGWGTVQHSGVRPRFRCTSAPAWILPASNRLG